ncbi:Hypothetical protein A7982_04602 [Minicystis rosea]|nr:Hypothetical protein A7982_04602 [Minicystis rosea]
MKTSCVVTFVLALVSLAGCAASPEPLRVRAADLGKDGAVLDTKNRPLIIELAEGDTLPVDFSLTSDLVELAPAAPALSLRARRRFFVRIDRDGVKTSLDGVHFGERPAHPGSFRFGLSATPKGTRVEVDIKAPVHAPVGG